MIVRISPPFVCIPERTLRRNSDLCTELFESTRWKREQFGSSGLHTNGIWETTRATDLRFVILPVAIYYMYYVWRDGTVVLVTSVLCCRRVLSSLKNDTGRRTDIYPKSGTGTTNLSNRNCMNRYSGTRVCMKHEAWSMNRQTTNDATIIQYIYIYWMKQMLVLLVFNYLEQILWCRVVVRLPDELDFSLLY